MRLVFLSDLTGGLAYRGCYGYGGPRQSPALPRAIEKTELRQRKFKTLDRHVIHVDLNSSRKFIAGN